MTPSEFLLKIKESSSPLPGSVASSIYYKMHVKLKHDNLPILEYLSQAIPSVSIEKWTTKILTQNLKVNGKPIDLDFKVKASWLVEHVSEPRVEPTVSDNIQLIYEDNDILVINKPAPLPMHSSGRFIRNTLENLLKIAFPKQEYKLIHRLDANTTGVVILGKTKKSTASLHLQFQQQQIKKEYLALVEGVILNNDFTSNQSIGKIKTESGGRAISEKGSNAFTEFFVLKRYEKTTLLKVIPHTGKTNQIRLHLADLGHPIVGDIGYKDERYFKNNPLTYSEDSLFLHAWKISFTHPGSNESISFEAEVPLKFFSK